MVSRLSLDHVHSACTTATIADPARRFAPEHRIRADGEAALNAVSSAPDSRCSGDLVEPARLDVVDEAPHLIRLRDEGALLDPSDRVADVPFKVRK
jgi:hypothetical protein